MNIVSLKNLRSALLDEVNKVYYTGDQTVVERKGKPLVVIRKLTAEEIAEFEDKKAQ